MAINNQNSIYSNPTPLSLITTYINVAEEATTYYIGTIIIIPHKIINNKFISI